MLEKYGVEMIGARPEVIDKAENRQQFKEAMERIGLEVCRGETVHNLAEARAAAADRSACRASCAPASRWAAAARPSPTTATSSTRWCAAGSSYRRFTRC